MHLGWGKEGRDCVSFLGMQERNSFQTLEIQHACSQAFEKDEEKRREDSPLSLSLEPQGERLTGKDSWERDYLETKRLNGYKLRNTRRKRDQIL